MAAALLAAPRFPSPCLKRIQSYASGAQGWIFRPRHHRRGASPRCRDGFASSCSIFSLTVGEASRAPGEGWILRLGLLAPRALGDSRFGPLSLDPAQWRGYTACTANRGALSCY